MQSYRQLLRLFVLAGAIILSGCGEEPIEQEQEPVPMNQNIFLVKGHLASCPNSPNCVNSEAAEGKSAIAPIALFEIPAQDWQKLKTIIADSGGRMETVSDDFLHATFRSRIFRFVDDLVCRLDRENGLIHIRSASRIGYSDFGVNRKRVEMIRTRMEQTNG